ncbi:M12 family metallopeptidase [Paludibacterium yongneupense]|uniref:M12 family metallopeptidase n=1 Tax=Paludibacterium yongneupense TaxID=400061 RepID=UPI000406CBE8|nr:M12 family metallopeptidase [Paludibacterium yongneupense]
MTLLRTPAPQHGLPLAALLFATVGAVGQASPHLPTAETLASHTGQRIQYQIDGEDAVIGDIILGRHDDIQRAGGVQAIALTPAQDTVATHRVRRASRQPRAALWPDNRVYYSLQQANASGRAAIRAAIADIEAVSALRFIERSNQNAYIDVHSPAAACRSSIGRTGGAQKLQLADWCAHKGQALHEIMHALGFSHEHQRPDRGEHIAIDALAELPDLVIKPRIETRTRYDIHSITHYRPPILHPLDPALQLSPELGGLSAGDIQALNALYPPRGVQGRLDASTLEIVSDGVAHLLVQGGGQPLKQPGISLRGARGLEIIILTLRDNERRLIIKPHSFLGHSLLEVTLHYLDGRTQTLPLPLRVDARDAHESGRPLLARASGLCLQAGGDGPYSLTMRPCLAMDAQRWRHLTSGEIVSAARPGHCLEATQARTAQLRPCQSGARQYWHAAGQRLLNGADAARPLRHDPAGALFTDKADDSALEEQWDWG